MYHTWTPEPLWPSPVAPPLPYSDTACRIVAELSGAWQGGTVPGLYEEEAWEVSQTISVPDSGWLYFPYLVGNVALYVEGRLWSAAETSAWVPVIGPGSVRITLRGHGKGGIIGGAYLAARKGTVAWPIEPDSHRYERWGLEKAGTPSTSASGFITLWRKGSDKPAWPAWLWGLGMLLWGVVAYMSYPIREAHWRGPWASTPPHPVENALGFSIVGLLILLIAGWSAFLAFIAVAFLVEIVFFPWIGVSIEKIWQSWVPVLGIVWILGFVVPQEWLLWGAWVGRTLTVSLYMPRLAYLCMGVLYLYILVFP